MTYRVDDPYLPDWCQGAIACRYEGCDYGDGGICRRCGSRLRCHICGRFIRIDTVDTHYLPHVESENQE